MIVVSSTTFSSSNHRFHAIVHSRSTASYASRTALHAHVRLLAVFDQLNRLLRGDEFPQTVAAHHDHPIIIRQVILHAEHTTASLQYTFLLRGKGWLVIVRQLRHHAVLAFLRRQYGTRVTHIQHYEMLATDDADYRCRAAELRFDEPTCALYQWRKDTLDAITLCLV